MASAVRSTRWIAVLALVAAGIALGLGIWGVVAPAGASAGCQTQAWDVTPSGSTLPAGWTVSATQYDLQRKTMSLVGPVPVDDTSAQAVVYVTVTCFNEGAADSVVRSAKAAADAGQNVTNRDDLGDQAFEATDDTGAVFLQLRHGHLVVYLAASGDATPDEVDALASAFDKALGGDGGAISLASDKPGGATPGPTSLSSTDPAGTSQEPAASAAAPKLEAALPAEVNGIALTINSALGSDILSSDQGSRAILAALRADGAGPEDLSVAQAYDESGAADITIMAVTVTGMPIANTEKLVLDSWLAASGSGITRTGITLAGAPWTQVDYGDEGARDYVASRGDIVFVITTADPSLAALAAAALP